MGGAPAPRVFREREVRGPPRDRNCISVEVVAMQAGKGDGLAVGRPSMKVGGTIRGDKSGRSAGRGDNVDPGLPVGILIADGNQAAIGRNAMVTIDLRLRAGRNEG